MNWLTAFGLAVMCLVAIFALLRVERRAIWVVVVLLVLPGLGVLWAWATIGEQLPEVLTGVALAATVTVVWWLAIGRRLKRPSSDSITVWGQEKAPRPQPGEVAALQAEVLRLKEENERLAASVRSENGGREK